MMLRQSDRRFLAFLIACVLILLLSALNISRFANRAYRQDEAVILSLVTSGDPYAELMIPVTTSLTLPSSFLSFSRWVGLFGQHEHVVRLLPVLLGTLTMSLVFRLASDLFDYKTGLFAVFMLGSWPLYQFYAYEVRPYALLVLGAAGTTWAFLRWIQYKRGRYALLYFLFGTVMVNAHLFGVYVPLGHALLYILLIRFNRRQALSLLGIIASVYLSFSATALIVLQGMVFHASNESEGKRVLFPSQLDSIPTLLNQILAQPIIIAVLLVCSALLIPLRVSNRSLKIVDTRWATWGKWYVIIPIISVLVIVWTINRFIPHLLPRYLIILVPGLALVSAYTLRHLPSGASAIAILLIATQTLSPTWPITISLATGRYWELVTTIASDYRAESRFVIDASVGWQTWGYNYFISQRLPEHVTADRLLFITDDIPVSGVNNLYPLPKYHIQNLTAETVSLFNDFSESSEQIWYVRDIDYPAS